MPDLNGLVDCSLFINDLSLHDCSRDLVLAGTQQSVELKLALDQEQQKSRKLVQSMKKLDEEMKRTDELLYQMIPKQVADRIRRGENPVETCQTFESVSILFTDVVNFTDICSRITPLQVVSMLNHMYFLFDQLSERNGVYKVETVGDSYMVVSGAPIQNFQHAERICDMAMDIIDASEAIDDPSGRENGLRVRVGCHSGVVVAGVVGIKMPRYCLFGDTVNTASRMESTGEPGKIQISESVKNLLPSLYSFELRGTINIKGKGDMCTYWLTGREARVPLSKYYSKTIVWTAPTATLLDGIGRPMSPTATHKYAESTTKTPTLPTSGTITSVKNLSKERVAAAFKNPQLRIKPQLQFKFTRGSTASLSPTGSPTEPLRNVPVTNHGSTKTINNILPDQPPKPTKHPISKSFENLESDENIQFYFAKNLESKRKEGEKKVNTIPPTTIYDSDLIKEALKSPVGKPPEKCSMMSTVKPEVQATMIMAGIIPETRTSQSHSQVHISHDINRHMNMPTSVGEGLLTEYIMAVEKGLHEDRNRNSQKEIIHELASIVTPDRRPSNTDESQKEEGSESTRTSTACKETKDESASPRNQQRPDDISSIDSDDIEIKEFTGVSFKKPTEKPSKVDTNLKQAHQKEPESSRPRTLERKRFPTMKELESFDYDEPPQTCKKGFRPAPTSSSLLRKSSSTSWESDTSFSMGINSLFFGPKSLQKESKFSFTNVNKDSCFIDQQALMLEMCSGGRKMNPSSPKVSGSARIDDTLNEILGEEVDTGGKKPKTPPLKIIADVPDYEFKPVKKDLIPEDSSIILRKGESSKMDEKQRKESLIKDVCASSTNPDSKKLSDDGSLKIKGRGCDVNCNDEIENEHAVTIEEGSDGTTVLIGNKLAEVRVEKWIREEFAEAKKASIDTGEVSEDESSGDQLAPDCDEKWIKDTFNDDGEEKWIKYDNGSATPNPEDASTSMKENSNENNTSKRKKTPSTSTPEKTKEEKPQKKGTSSEPATEPAASLPKTKWQVEVKTISTKARSYQNIVKTVPSGATTRHSSSESVSQAPMSVPRSESEKDRKRTYEYGSSKESFRSKTLKHRDSSGTLIQEFDVTCCTVNPGVEHVHILSHPEPGKTRIEDSIVFSSPKVQPSTVPAETGKPPHQLEQSKGLATSTSALDKKAEAEEAFPENSRYRFFSVPDLGPAMLSEDLVTELHRNCVKYCYDCLSLPSYVDNDSAEEVFERPMEEKQTRAPKPKKGKEKRLKVKLVNFFHKIGDLPKPEK